MSFHCRIYMTDSKGLNQILHLHNAVLQISRGNRDHFPNFFIKTNVVTSLLESSQGDGANKGSFHIFVEKYEISFYRYSQLSLSQLRLSRITAYLQEKIWSLL